MADGTRLERQLRGARDDAAVEHPEDPALRLVLVDDHQLLHPHSSVQKVLVNCLFIQYLISERFALAIVRTQSLPLDPNRLSFAKAKGLAHQMTAPVERLTPAPIKSLLWK